MTRYDSDANLHVTTCNSDAIITASLKYNNSDVNVTTTFSYSNLMHFMYFVA